MKNLKILWPLGVFLAMLCLAGIPYIPTPGQHLSIDTNGLYEVTVGTNTTIGVKTNPVVSGTLTAGAFSGNGSGLTNYWTWADGSKLDASKTLIVFFGDSVTDTNGYAFPIYPLLLTNLSAWKGLKAFNDQAITGQGFIQNSNAWTVSTAAWVTNNASTGDTVLLAFGPFENDSIQGWYSNNASAYIVARSNFFNQVRSQIPSGVRCKISAMTTFQRELYLYDSSINRARYAFNLSLLENTNVDFYVPLHEVFPTPMDTNLFLISSPDTVHPNPAGHQIIAQTLDFGLRCGFSRIPRTVYRDGVQVTIASPQGTPIAKVFDYGYFNQIWVYPGMEDGQTNLVGPTASTPGFFMSKSASTAALLAQGMTNQTEAVLWVNDSTGSPKFRVYSDGRWTGGGISTNPAIELQSGGSGPTLFLNNPGTARFGLNSSSAGNFEIQDEADGFGFIKANRGMLKIGQSNAQVSSTNWGPMNVEGNLTVENGGSFSVVGGLASLKSVASASTAITFPSSGTTWTNSQGINIVLYIDNSGVTGTTLSKNGQQIFSSLIGDMTVLMKPGDYFSEAYTLGSPTARWEPQ